MKASLPKISMVTKLGSLVNLQRKSPSSGSSPIKGGQSKAKARQGGLKNQSPAKTWFIGCICTLQPSAAHKSNATPRL